MTSFASRFVDWLRRCGCLAREAWQFNYFEQVATDIRYGFRQLWKNPGFTLTAVISLALGIGATTAVFSVIYAVLIHPFPYAAADRIIRITTEDKGGNLHRVALTGSQLQSIRKADCVEDAVAWLNWELNTTGSDLPEDVKAVFITANASNYFGVPPLQGRGLIPADAPPRGDAQPVVVLSYSFWNRHLGRSPTVMGKTLQMAHKDYTIVGVLPPRFAWNGGDVYLPLQISYDQAQLYGISIRLKPNVSLRAAASELQSLFQEFAKDTPTRYPENFRIHLERLNDQYVNGFGRMLYLLFGAVVLLLFIGCSNLSILLLARGAARQHELAIRAAVGSSRSRLLRQLLTESVTLSLIGAGTGILTAYAMVALIVKWLPAYSVAREVAIDINLPVLAFCVLLALLTGILFGLSPALQMVRPQLEHVLRSGTRTIAGRAATKRTHNMLLAGQMALTLLLLTGAGSAIQGFRRVTHVHLGYDPQDTLDVDIPLHPNSYVKQEERAVYFETLRRRVAGIRGVTSVALTDNAVPPFSGVMQRVELMGESSREWHQASLNLVSANYFSTLKIALSRGRLWDAAEAARGARLAIVNATMARQFWPHDDPLGHAIRLPELKPEPPFRVSIPESDGWLQIIGVVADSQNDGLLAPVKPAVYISSTIWMGMGIDLLVHTQTSPARMLHVIRQQLAFVNPDQQIPDYTPTLGELVQTQPEWQQERLVTLLCGIFAGIALILAVIGLYSVVSYAVAQRTNEFGIRMALGATRKKILRVVLSSFSASIGFGIGIGVLLAVGLDSFLTKLSEGTGGHPVIILGVVALLASACICACFVPAWRAASVDPMTALRNE